MHENYNNISTSFSIIPYIPNITLIYSCKKTYFNYINILSFNMYNKIYITIKFNKKNKIIGTYLIIFINDNKLFK